MGARHLYFGSLFIYYVIVLFLRKTYIFEMSFCFDSYKWYVPFVYGVMDESQKIVENKIWLNMTQGKFSLV